MLGVKNVDKSFMKKEKMTNNEFEKINQLIFGTSATRRNEVYEDIDLFVDGFITFFELETITKKQKELLKKLRLLHLDIMTKRMRVADRVQSNESMDIVYYFFSLFLKGTNKRINTLFKNISSNDTTTDDSAAEIKRKKAHTYYFYRYLNCGDKVQKSEEFLLLSPLFKNFPK